MGSRKNEEKKNVSASERRVRKREIKRSRGNKWRIRKQNWKRTRKRASRYVGRDRGKKGTK